MIKDSEIVDKFKKGASIKGLINFILYQEKADNAIRKKEDRVKTTGAQVRNIVENAVYQDMIKRQL